MEISLIIPTHNRAATLEGAIESAAKQSFSTDRYEILVVDNASRDTTSKTVRRVRERFPERRIRYVAEQHLGLHHARHAGARHAAGKILVFTDDDATFEPDWLAVYASVFASHPEMAAAGGPVRPRFEAAPPGWLGELMGQGKEFSPLSLMDLGDEFRIDAGTFFWGVNMAIRREVLFAVGGFNPEAFGTVWLGDGESGLNRKLREKQLAIGYVPTARVYHRIPAERMTLGYLRRRMANEGAADVYVRFGRSCPSRRALLGYAVDIVRRYARSWAAAAWRRGRTDEKAVASQLEAARTRSRLAYALRLLSSARLRRLIARHDWLNE